MTKLVLVAANGVQTNHIILEPHSLMELVAKLAARIADVTDIPSARDLLDKVATVLKEEDLVHDEAVSDEEAYRRWHVADQILEEYIKTFDNEA